MPNQIDHPVYLKQFYCHQEFGHEWVHSDLEDELVFLKDEESTLDHPVQDILNLLPLVQFG